MLARQVAASSVRPLEGSTRLAEQSAPQSRSADMSAATEAMPSAAEGASLPGPVAPGSASSTANAGASGAVDTDHGVTRDTGKLVSSTQTQAAADVTPASQQMQRPDASQEAAESAAGLQQTTVSKGTVAPSRTTSAVGPASPDAVSFPSEQITSTTPIADPEDEEVRSEPAQSVGRSAAAAEASAGISQQINDVGSNLQLPPLASTESQQETDAAEQQIGTQPGLSLNVLGLRNRVDQLLADVRVSNTHLPAPCSFFSTLTQLQMLLVSMGWLLMQVARSTSLPTTRTAAIAPEAAAQFIALADGTQQVQSQMASPASEQVQAATEAVSGSEPGPAAAAARPQLQQPAATACQPPLRTNTGDAQRYKDEPEDHARPKPACTPRLPTIPQPFAFEERARQRPKNLAQVCISSA